MSVLLKSTNKFKNIMVKKEFITFFSTFSNFIENEKKNIITQSKIIGNSTEHHDELFISMIIEEIDNEDIIETKRLKYVFQKKNDENSFLF